MTTGEGGLITTDDDALADWLRLYRNQGMRERYQHEMLGYNFRMTDLAAAIGLCQLDKLERNTARRQAIAARYDAAFADLPIRPAGHARPAGPTSSTSTRSTSAAPATRSSPTSREAGVGDRHLLPDPGPSPGYILERGLHADLPVTDARRRRGRSRCRCIPALTDDEQDDGHRGGPRRRRAPCGRAPIAAGRRQPPDGAAR